MDVVHATMTPSVGSDEQMDKVPEPAGRTERATGMTMRIDGRAVCVMLALTLAAAGCSSDGDVEEQGTPVPSTAPAQAEDGQSPVPEPSDTPEPESESEPEVATSGEPYVVESGDTLSSIAQRFDTTVTAIVEANDLDDPDLIVVGDELVVPPAP
jgi:LysM repeat protein